jgi:hypothetical protein
MQMQAVDGCERLAGARGEGGEGPFRRVRRRFRWLPRATRAGDDGRKWLNRQVPTTWESRQGDPEN